MACDLGVVFGGRWVMNNVSATDVLQHIAGRQALSIKEFAPAALQYLAEGSIILEPFSGTWYRADFTELNVTYHIDDESWYAT